MAYFAGAIAVVGGLGWAIRNGKFSLGPLDKIFNADEITPAGYEEMHIERSGATLDYVPQSLSESFMGYQYLDLEHTTMVANDLPFGPGVIDHQYLYENAYDLGYNDDDLIADMNRENPPSTRIRSFRDGSRSPGPRCCLWTLKGN